MATSYLTTEEPNVRFEVIATVGDVLDTKADGSDYRYVGIPDGLGAFDNGDGTITVLSNHELPGASGIVREHGSTGAFVTRLVVDKETLEVISAEDAIKTVMLYDETTNSFVQGTTQFSRFCSADLAKPTAFFNAASGLGTDARIYLTGEESGPEGRAFGIVVDGAGEGTAYELDSLGNFSWENAVASPFAQDKTIVIGTDDATPGQVYVYVGQKQSTGNAVEMAGLVGGSLYGIAVQGVQNEQNGLIASGSRFSLIPVGNNGDASDITGAQLDAQSDALGVTEFLRPEDAQFDPTNPNVLYFVTTAEPTRLLKVTFDDINNPLAGGKVDVVADPSDGVLFLDNMTVAEDGKVYLQEDPGSDTRLAKIWVYDPATDEVSFLGEHNPDLFAPGAPNFKTTNEESSGIIDVTDMLGDADTQAFLLDVQSHNGLDPELVEDGQLLAMFVDDPFLIGTNKGDDLFGSSASEMLDGKNGDDTALAGSGDDEVLGGNGQDELHGGNGNDILKGDNGKDVLFGDAGDDTLLGGHSNDWFVVDNTSDSGDDVVDDFARGDLILLTEKIADPDGRIDLANGVLALSGGGSVDVGISALQFDGTVVLEGTTYYAYEAAKGFQVVESAI